MQNGVLLRSEDNILVYKYVMYSCGPLMHYQSMPHLGQEIWQAMVGVLQLIKLITHTICNHHALLSLLKVNDLRDQAVTCITYFVNATESRPDTH